jgi:hemerythrin-like domain-containing protein
MTATEELLMDHVFIRRLQLIIEKCYTTLYDGKNIPAGDLIKILNIIEHFVDQFHHGKEENSYFPKAQKRDYSYSDEIRKFVIEHEFGRRIAKRIRFHLEEFLQDNDRREPLARYLKTYSVFILDHTSKEDSFFIRLKEKKSLSEEEERMLKEQFDYLKVECLHKVSNGNSNNFIQTLELLESSDWAR